MQRDALRAMISAVGVPVEVVGQGGSATAATALISYEQDDLAPDWEERQNTRVLLLRDEIDAVPNNATITEIDTGLEHHVVSVRIAPHHITCFCELRAARRFTGPFKR